MHFLSFEFCTNESLDPVITKIADMNHELFSHVAMTQEHLELVTLLILLCSSIFIITFWAFDRNF